MVVSGTADNLC